MTKKAIDFYSGIGGWTLGMKLSGIKSLGAFEWWKEANQTHNQNFGTNHSEINIRKIDPKRDLKQFKGIDFIVGSPPCTQFSYANRGGSGDIADGLKDINKFLEIVRYLKPKYWAMENVPRVAKILEKEIEDGGELSEFKDLISVIEVINCDEFGVPQKRKRAIAGHFPFDLFISYKKHIQNKTLNDVLNSLKGNDVFDLNYGYRLNKRDLSDHDHEPSLTREEERINRDSKTFHPVYNKMSFPEKLDLPARTITATCTRVSRESLIVKATKGFRRLTVRERGVIQGFPITYQFYGKTINSKYKMIGNAIPPIITYYLFQSMLENPVEKVLGLDEVEYKHEIPKEPSPITEPDITKRKFPKTRKFRFAIPNLRYGSGVRFELSNEFQNKHPQWSFKFFYGKSTDIKELKLNGSVIEKIEADSQSHFVNEIIEKASSLKNKYETLGSNELQSNWISDTENHLAFQFIDDIGLTINELMEFQSLVDEPFNKIESLFFEPNKKIEENSYSILIGCYLLSILNNKFFELK